MWPLNHKFRRDPGSPFNFQQGSGQLTTTASLLVLKHLLHGISALPSLAMGWLRWVRIKWPLSSWTPCRAHFAFISALEPALWSLDKCRFYKNKQISVALGWGGCASWSCLLQARPGQGEPTLGTWDTTKAGPASRPAGRVLLALWAQTYSFV